MVAGELRGSAAWRGRGGRHADFGWTLLLVTLLLGPLLLGSGYALVGDMVFVPNQPWKSAWLGLDGAVPRFVPGEAVVWALTSVLPGHWVQVLLLAGAFVTAGLGMSRLTSGLDLPARWVAIAVVIWNPWTFERLAIGQWPMLWGFAVLPWLVAGALAVSRGPAARFNLPLVVGLVVAALASPPSALTALLVALVLTWRRGDVAFTGRLLAFGVLINLPWIVPALAVGHTPRASVAQFAAFGLRAESDGGAWLSALSGGGLWKGSVVPAERGALLVVAASAVLALLAAWSLRRAPIEERPVAVRLAATAVVLGLGAWLMGTGPFPHWLGEASQHFSALGILRDAHRWLAPWLVVVAWGAAHGVHALLRAGRRDGAEGLRVLACAAPLLPLALLPSFAWGMWGKLEPVQYPDDWLVVQRLAPETTVVLPWHGSYRGFEWNEHRAMLDPAPRMFGGDVLIDDRILLHEGVRLESEDPFLTDVGHALAAPDPAAGLRDLGVRRVIVNKHNGVEPERVPHGTVVHDGPDLQVIDLGPGAAMNRARPSARIVVSAAVLALGAALVGIGFGVRGGRRRPGRSSMNGSGMNGSGMNGSGHE